MFQFCRSLKVSHTHMRKWFLIQYAVFGIDEIFLPSEPLISTTDEQRSKKEVHIDLKIRQTQR